MSRHGKADQSGNPITKQFSSSLFIPSTLQHYQTVLKIYQTGPLLIQVNTSHRWDPKWAELKDGVFRYADAVDQPSTSIFIPIENIIRLVTKNDLIVMKTKNEKIQMKTEIPSEIGVWIFSFQKSVALALMKIREQGPMSALVSHEDYTHSIGGGRQRQRSEDWTKEEFGGQGHGLQSCFNKTRTMMAQHATSIADARHSSHIGSRQSIDDSLTVMVQRGKVGSESHRENDFSYLSSQTPPRSAPSSPLKMNWNPHQHSSATTPERTYYHHEDYSLGLCEDVVLPDIPISPKGRETSGKSDGNSVSGSVESLGGMGTWKSVDGLASLDDETHERSRSHESLDAFRLDEDDGSERYSEPNLPEIRLNAGYCSRLGPRSSNEDRFVALVDLHQEVNDFMSKCQNHPNHFSFYGDDRGSNWKNLTSPPRSSSHTDAYFAVYDGHSGSLASQFLCNVLHHSIYTHPLFEENLEDAITDTCINLDRQFLEYCRAHSLYCGTTAVGALITELGRRLTVFNIGDSEAILYRAGEVIELTSKHSPNRPDEKSRIIAAQGWITEEKELYYGRLHRMDLEDEYILERANDLQWTYIHRVCGEIAVSRSIGDIPYKGYTPGQVVNEPFAWPQDHDQIFSADLVIPNPEFQVLSLTDRDEFMILASDGLWDVMSSQDACIRVRELLGRPDYTPQTIADELCDLAIRLGSSDNVTIVIVQFIHEQF